MDLGSAFHRLKVSRSVVKLKHADASSGDVETYLSPTLVAERAGADWAMTHAEYRELTSLFKARAGMSDQQWKNSFYVRELPGPAYWFWSLIIPDYDITDPDDDSPSALWNDSEIPALRDRELTPEFVLAFADGALAVYDAFLRSL